VRGLDPYAYRAFAARDLLAGLDDAGRARISPPVDAVEWQTWANPEFMQFDTGLRLDCQPAEVIALYGTPDERAPRGWQLYGHHCAVNCLVVAGRMVLSPGFRRPGASCCYPTERMTGCPFRPYLVETTADNGRATGGRPRYRRAAALQAGGRAPPAGGERVAAAERGGEGVLVAVADGGGDLGRGRVGPGELVLGALHPYPGDAGPGRLPGDLVEARGEGGAGHPGQVGEGRHGPVAVGAACTRSRIRRRAGSARARYQPGAAASAVAHQARRAKTRFRSSSRSSRVCWPGASRLAWSASRHTAVPFNWNDSATWPATLAGADGVFIVGPGSATDWSPRLARLLDVAAAAGVRRAVLLSARAVEFLPGGAVDRAERALRDGPVPWTILRPAHFAQNFTEARFVPRAGVIHAPAALAASRSSTWPISPTWPGRS
jgi:hypothetical protein